ncbi:MAG: UbiH/UbiF/VisC/COQ6 family ubiquinone biosynthesis hydroxylase [Pseudomonadota bacterium]
MKPRADYDVIIIGGGPTGATLACALAQADFQVALVEARDFPPELSNDYDLRIYAINRASENILRQLGAWTHLSGPRILPYREMHVWEELGEIHFHCDDIDAENLGHIIENQTLESALNQCVASFSSIHWQRPARIAHIDIQVSSAKVTLQDGSSLQAPLVIGADGGQSKVRELLDIPCNISDYNQLAIVGNIRTAESHQDTAWQRFLPDGPLAFLPLPEPNLLSIVWSVRTMQARKLLNMTDAAFCDALSQASEYCLGNVESVSKRASFPLQRRHADHYVQPRAALIGDAVRSIHPLAGQGMNLGLLDVATLAETLIDAKYRGRDIGELLTLRRYERRRKGHNLLMLNMMDNLNRLFSNSIPPVKWLRNLGLNLTDLTAPAKRLFMSQALGISGDRPTLVRSKTDVESAAKF